MAKKLKKDNQCKTCYYFMNNNCYNDLDNIDNMCKYHHLYDIIKTKKFKNKNEEFFKFNKNIIIRYFRYKELRKNEIVIDTTYFIEGYDNYEHLTIMLNGKKEVRKNAYISDAWTGDVLYINQDTQDLKQAIINSAIEKFEFLLTCHNYILKKECIAYYYIKYYNPKLRQYYTTYSWDKKTNKEQEVYHRPKLGE